VVTLCLCPSHIGSVRPPPYVQLAEGYLGLSGQAQWAIL
jgi:hypothetical protein